MISDTAVISHSEQPTSTVDVATRTIESPVGRLLLRARADALTGLFFQASRAVTDLPSRTAVQFDVLDSAEAQLDEYFRGRRRSFDLPLAPEGTAFQQSVWSLLQEIPYGRTLSYGKLASALGDPNKSRAVGLANGSNPIGIIIPCHRVVGADGSLTGFGGGITVKRWLLLHEGADLRDVDGEGNQFALPF